MLVLRAGLLRCGRRTVLKLLWQMTIADKDLIDFRVVNAKVTLECYSVKRYPDHSRLTCTLNVGDI